MTSAMLYYVMCFQVTCSVPQRSVLGPRMFIMYTAVLEEKVDEHGVGVNYHAYADDTQLYLRCRCELEDTSTAVDTFEHCSTDVKNVNQWISANRLKLNPEKTELLWPGSRQREVVGQLSRSALIPSRLAVMYDSLELSCHLSLEKHVSVICAACFFHLR